MDTPFLELKNISKSFGGVKALSNVSLMVDKGEAYCLMGENGSGKSTLIKIISGVYEADDGELVLEGKSFKRLTPTESIRAGIQIIYQDFSIFPNLSVAENIAISNMFINKRKFVNKKELNEIASLALEKIGVRFPMDELVGRLPVAGKQIVAIARGLAQDVKLLVMDEPTTTLTHKEILALYDIINSLKRKGISIIFVSHKLEEIFNISEKVMVLRNGKKVFDDKIEKMDRNSLTYYMTGREIPQIPYTYKMDEAKDIPVLKVEKLSQRGAFDDVSFSLYSKEILGITGQLGCGRTELAKALFGIGKTNGQIEMNGERVMIGSILEACKLGISYVPEDRLNEGLFLERSLTDNITVAAIDSIAHGIMLDSGELEKTAEGWLDELEIAADGPDVPARNLSGGNQQRIVLAKWLATRPKLLILNCPTVGVDVGSKNQIHEIVKKLAAEGIGIIVISDDIGEILTLCNRVLLMKNGRVIREIESGSITIEQLEYDVISDVKEEAG